MSDVGWILQALAGSMHLWRNGAVAGLAIFAIGMLHLYASFMGVK